MMTDERSPLLTTVPVSSTPPRRYPHQTLRRLCTAALAASLCALLAVFLVLLVFDIPGVAFLSFEIRRRSGEISASGLAVRIANKFRSVRSFDSSRGSGVVGIVRRVEDEIQRCSIQFPAVRRGWVVQRARIYAVRGDRGVAIGVWWRVIGRRSLR